MSSKWEVFVGDALDAMRSSSRIKLPSQMLVVIGIGSTALGAWFALLRVFWIRVGPFETTTFLLTTVFLSSLGALLGLIQLAKQPSRMVVSSKSSPNKTETCCEDERGEASHLGAFNQIRTSSMTRRRDAPHTAGTQSKQKSSMADDRSGRITRTDPIAIAIPAAVSEIQSEKRELLAAAAPFPALTEVARRESEYQAMRASESESVARLQGLVAHLESQAARLSSGVGSVSELLDSSKLSAIREFVGNSCQKLVADCDRLLQSEKELRERQLEIQGLIDINESRLRRSETQLRHAANQLRERRGRCKSLTVKEKRTREDCRELEQRRIRMEGGLEAMSKQRKRLESELLSHEARLQTRRDRLAQASADLDTEKRNTEIAQANLVLVKQQIEEVEHKLKTRHIEFEKMESDCRESQLKLNANKTELLQTDSLIRERAATIGRLESKMEACQRAIRNLEADEHHLKKQVNFFRRCRDHIVGKQEGANHGKSGKSTSAET